MTTTPARKVYYFPDTKEEIRARGYDSLKYPAIANRLHNNGWRKQEKAMTFWADETQRVEWWNKGPRVLLVYVYVDSDSSQTCVVYRPTRVRSALNAIGNKEGKV